MGHESELAVVLVACLALVIGAAARLFSRRTRVPYTVLMLLAGLVTGVAVSGTEIGHMISADGLVTPHLIIFVFLPALIFESAFALDQHTFWNERGAVALLAVPALLLATGLTALAMLGLTSFSWGWSLAAALVFGALISATDPVAVVATLREIGAPKRLSVLIEGESLMNDGTAIVIFGVLLSLLTSGQLSSADMAFAGLEFVWVVLGGALVGFLLALAASKVMARAFNDGLTEITVTLSTAYLAMAVAEGLLHVSGVIAVVVAGLWLGGRGRVTISTNVSAFLGKFWEMLAYVANTLIFFLVGLVISAQLSAATWTDLLLVLGAYVIVMLVRFAVTFGLRPLLSRLAPGTVSSREVLALSWGGLRGAVALALALVVSQTPGLDPELQRQVLLATAGVVLLSILVNGWSSRLVMARLGLQEKPLGEALVEATVQNQSLNRIRHKLSVLTREQSLRALNWRKVNLELRERRRSLAEHLAQIEAEMSGAPPQERLEGYWREALALERQVYWSAFAEGSIGPGTLRRLDLAVDRHLDRLESGDLDPPRTRVEPLTRGQRAWRWAASRLSRLEFLRLQLLYGVARGQMLAAERVLAELEALGGWSADAMATIEAAYENLRRDGKQRVEEMRVNLPEVTEAIESRLTQRIMLNLERKALQELRRNGALDEHTSEDELGKIESRMKRLQFEPLDVELPTLEELLEKTQHFGPLHEELRSQIAQLATERVLAQGEVLFTQGDDGDAVCVIARGAAEVLREGPEGETVLLDILGAGELCGEMAFMTDAPRTATIKAATTLVVGQLDHQDMRALFEKHPELEAHVWDIFAQRQFDNLVRRLSRFSHLSRLQRERWVAGRPIPELVAGEVCAPDGCAFIFVVMGALSYGKTRHTAPCLIDTSDLAEPLVADALSRFIRLPLQEEVRPGLGSKGT